MKIIPKLQTAYQPLVLLSQQQQPDLLSELNQYNKDKWLRDHTMTYYTDKDYYTGSQTRLKGITVTGKKPKKQYKWATASTNQLQPSELLYPLSYPMEKLREHTFNSPVDKFVWDKVFPALSMGNWMVGAGKSKSFWSTPRVGAQIRANDERQLGAYLPFDFFVGPKIMNKTGKTVKTTGDLGKTFVSSKLAGNTWGEAAIDAVAKTPVGKRAAEVAMRSRYDMHGSANPVPDILQGWLTAPWNRRGAVLDYILTEGKFSKTGNKPFGYSESLAPFKEKGQIAMGKEIYLPLIDQFMDANWRGKISQLFRVQRLANKNQRHGGTTYNWGKYNGEPEVAYTGGFWDNHLPRKSSYGDAIDAYLYGTEIDPGYGMRRISVGKPEDFGMHKNHVAENFPERSDKIQVYETEPIPDNDIVTDRFIKSNGYHSDIESNILTPTSKYDAAGHWMESGSVLDSNGNPIMETRYRLFDKATGYAKTPWVLEKQLPKDFRSNPNYTYKESVQPKTVYRNQDIWKFNEDYPKKWGPKIDAHDAITLSQLGSIGKLGVRLVDKAGTPMIVRTPWRYDYLQHP